ncbi:hypothetical protein FB451DRAFT_1215695 [Mycena latifolia]|nr:hypothetical protein FB451DRAFT_1215695 [Mycena latifolia]
MQVLRLPLPPRAYVDCEFGRSFGMHGVSLLPLIFSCGVFFKKRNLYVWVLTMSAQTLLAAKPFFFSPFELE